MRELSARFEVGEGHSVVNLIFTFAQTDNPDEVRSSDAYDIAIESITLKSAGKFPIIVAEPTSITRISFCCHSDSVTKPEWDPFFTGNLSLEPNAADTRGKITFEPRGDGGQPGWVLPQSGVMFTWRLHGADALPR